MGSYYDTIAKKYSKISKARNLYLNAINEIIVEVILTHKISSMLDVGTGDGIRLKKILHYSSIKQNKILAIEPSKKMFSIAKKQLEKRCKVVNSDIYGVNKSKKFDCIIVLWNVIGHINNLGPFLKACEERLSPNGILIFDFNNVFNIKNYGLLNFFKNFLLFLAGKKIFSFSLSHLYEEKVNMYTKNYLKTLLKQAKLKVYYNCYIDYDTGNKVNKFSGQNLYLCKKLN